MNIDTLIDDFSPLVSVHSLLCLHPAPVSLSSLHVSSTTTTALLTWKLHGKQSLSTLSLYNTHTRSITHIFNMMPSEGAKSQYTVLGLQHGTRFKVNVLVTTLLKHYNVVLKQRLSIGMETGLIHKLYSKHTSNMTLTVSWRLFLVSSSLSSRLAGQWEKLLHCEKKRFKLEWSPAQLQTPGSWESAGWPEDTRGSAFCICSSAGPQQPAAAVDRTQWSEGSLFHYHTF